MCEDHRVWNGCMRKPQKCEKNAHLRMSLFKTSTYCFTSATSTGSLALRSENGERGAPSSTYWPPGWRRPPTRRISKRASAYFRNSRVEPAWTSLFVIASKSVGGTFSRYLRNWSRKTGEQKGSRESPAGSVGCCRAHRRVRVCLEP